MFQDVYLFDGTIGENVRLGRPDADEVEVRAVAAAARLDEVVGRLPGGWATHVGEGGALLSGGERRRVSIARALLKDAPVVLLDEVTSALDPVNEAAVHEGVERLVAGRTVVMVAHRRAPPGAPTASPSSTAAGSWSRGATTSCCASAAVAPTSGTSPRRCDTPSVGSDQAEGAGRPRTLLTAEANP